MQAKRTTPVSKHLKPLMKEEQKNVVTLKGQDFHQQKSLEAQKKLLDRQEKQRMKRWSENRPVKPDADTLMLQIVEELKNNALSVWEKADKTGLSEHTIRNWENKKTRFPQAVSLQMAAAALGGRIAFVKDKKK